MKIFQKIKYYLELINQGFIKKNYKIFYSQFGEDRIIYEILKKKKKRYLRRCWMLSSKKIFKYISITQR